MRDPSDPSRVNAIFPRLHLTVVSNLQQYYQKEGFPEQVTKLLLSATWSSARKKVPVSMEPKPFAAEVGGVLKEKINPL